MAANPPAHIDLWSHRALAIAALGRVGRHAHAASALLVGLDGEFSIRHRREWRRTTTAFVPAGVSHELECDATLMATLYVFPLSGEPEALADRLHIQPNRLRTHVCLDPTLRQWLLALHGGDFDRAMTRKQLDQLIGPPSPTALDPRIARAATFLKERAAQTLSVAELSEVASVSESRLMHLFKADVGIPIRRFRAWERMRLLTEHVAAGESLTMAALAAGFADSAHLSHGFRGMFGIAASKVLNSHSRLRAGR